MHVVTSLGDGHKLSVRLRRHSLCDPNVETAFRTDDQRPTFHVAPFIPVRSLLCFTGRIDEPLDLEGWEQSAFPQLQSIDPGIRPQTSPAEAFDGLVSTAARYRPRPQPAQKPRAAARDSAASVLR